MQKRELVDNNIQHQERGPYMLVKHLKQYAGAQNYVCTYSQKKSYTYVLTPYIWSNGWLPTRSYDCDYLAIFHMTQILYPPG
jgi:hypothetical protein